MLTILHTNDFHNRLTDSQADRLRALREDLGDSAVLIDAGDAIGAGNITFRPGGEPILERMTRAGYDAMTVGNRDFHFSRVGFQTKLNRARFPILCANVRLSGSEEPRNAVEAWKSEDITPDPPVVSHVVLSRGGWTVAIFGVTVPMITQRMLVRKVSAYVFDDPIAAASRLVPWLRQRYSPDLVVALTHIGIKKDRELAAAGADIDLIVGGHSHVVLAEGERVGRTTIVQAGAWGNLLGRVQVRRGGDGTLDIQAGVEDL